MTAEVAGGRRVEVVPFLDEVLPAWRRSSSGELTRVLLWPAKLADWRLPAALADWRLQTTLDWRWPVADGGGGGRRL
jgi:hypothetical protein